MDLHHLILKNIKQNKHIPINPRICMKYNSALQYYIDGEACLINDNYYRNVFNYIYNKFFYAIKKHHYPDILTECLSQKWNEATDEPSNVGDELRAIRRLEWQEKFIDSIMPTKSHPFRSINFACEFTQMELLKHPLTVYSLSYLPLEDNCYTVCNTVSDEFLNIHYNNNTKRWSDYFFFLADINDDETSNNKKTDRLCDINETLKQFLSEIGITHWGDFATLTKYGKNIIKPENVINFFEILEKKDVIKYQPSKPLSEIINKILEPLIYAETNKKWYNFTYLTGSALSIGLMNFNNYKDYIKNIHGTIGLSPTEYIINILLLLSLMMGVKSLKPTIEAVKELTVLDDHYELYDIDAKEAKKVMRTAKKSN